MPELAPVIRIVFIEASFHIQMCMSRLKSHIQWCMSTEMSRRPRKPPRSRAETKQATREALIEAGIDEFARNGLDVGIEAICERAGLTRGAFHFHFADRDA